MGFNSGFEGLNTNTECDYIGNSLVSSYHPIF